MADVDIEADDDLKPELLHLCLLHIMRILILQPLSISLQILVQADDDDDGDDDDDDVYDGYSPACCDSQSLLTVFHFFLLYYLTHTFHSSVHLEQSTATKELGFLNFSFPL